MRTHQLLYKDFKDVFNGGCDEEGDLPTGVYMGFSAFAYNEGRSLVIYRMKFDAKILKRVEGNKISGLFEHSILETREAGCAPVKGNDEDFALERFEGVWFPEERRMLASGISWDAGSKHEQLEIGKEKYDLFFEGNNIFGRWASREEFGWGDLGDDGKFDQPVYMRRIPASVARMTYGKVKEYLAVDTDYFRAALSHDRKKERNIKIRGAINSITGIEQVSQTFGAKFTLVFEWPPSLQDIHYHVAGGNRNNFEPEWRPQRPALRNKIEHREEILESPPELVKLPDSTYVNRVTYTYNTILAESMELEHFPFDVQELQIQVELPADAKDDSERSNAEVAIPDFKREYVTVGNQIKEAFKSSEWVPQLGNYFIQPIERKGKGPYHFGIVLLKQRSVKIYFWRVMFVMGLISLSSLLSVGIGDPADNVGDKLGYTVTMVLAALAYSIVIADYLPRLSYLTTLDWYVIFTYVYICTWMAAQALLVRFANDDKVSIENVDRALGFGFFIAWVVFHCFVVWHVLHIRKFEKRKLIVQDKPITEQSQRETEQSQRDTTKMKSQDGLTDLNVSDLVNVYSA